MNLPVMLGVVIALAMLAAVGMMAYDTFRRPAAAAPEPPAESPPDEALPAQGTRQPQARN